MKVTLKMMMPIVAPSWDYIRMANMTASAAPAPEAIETPDSILSALSWC